MVTWSAVTPISWKALVMPRMRVSFWVSVFPVQVSTMTTGNVSPPRDAVVLVDVVFYRFPWLFRRLEYVEF